MTFSNGIYAVHQVEALAMSLTEVGRQVGKDMNATAQVDWTFFTSFRPLVDFRTGLSPAVMARILADGPVPREKKKQLTGQIL